MTKNSTVFPSLPHRCLAVPPTQVYETPFFVAVDHEKKKVVISIRGTLSLKVRLLPELFVLALQLRGEVFVSCSLSVLTRDSITPVQVKSPSVLQLLHPSGKEAGAFLK